MSLTTRVLRFSMILWAGWALSGCIQQASPGSQPGAQAASTQLAVQSTRISGLETANASLATELARQEDFISYLATRMPAGMPVPRDVTRTPIAEVDGTLSIEGGDCCVGGIAGEELSILVEFRARSTAAKVTQMRVATGLGFLDETAVYRAEWEPFADSRTFSVRPPINWVGFYVAVQYRDEVGNLSPVFRADISVEGSPPNPSAVPSP